MYNPMTKPATIEIDRMKAYEWLKNGAQPTDTVHAILRFKGVMYYKHLQRGVAKGALTPEDAEMKFRAWVDEKEARIEARVRATAAERKERAAQVSGTKKSPKKKQVENEDELLNVDLAKSAAAETAADAVPEETTETVAETATESAEPTTEETAETVAETATEETTETVAESIPESSEATAEDSSEKTTESEK